MRFYLAKTPEWIQNLFSNYLWKVKTDKKEIYLTFDDGPLPEITPWVLGTLKRYNAKATFFCVGQNIEKHTNIFRQILQHNHSIGNHTYNHLNGWKTNTSNYLDNIEKAEELIKRPKIDWSPATKNQKPKTKLFRPPYGKIKTSPVRALLKQDYEIIMWDVLSGDFDQKMSKEQCLKNAIKNTQNGSIIVFHDSEKAFKNLQYALPEFLEYFSEKGFEFCAL